MVVGEDYGEGASIIQERTHAFCMKSSIWLLDPRPDHPRLVELIEQAFELSEASSTPVMAEVRIRACHMRGRFAAKDNIHPAISTLHAADEARIRLRPHLPAPEHLCAGAGQGEPPLPAARDFIVARGMNEWLAGGPRRGRIIVQGGHTNTLLRALSRPRAGGRLRREPHPCAGAERHLPAGAGGG
jgi:indolepyruvate ferredoxin oxidoreductase alpha subunit